MEGSQHKCSLRLFSEVRSKALELQSLLGSNLRCGDNEFDPYTTLCPRSISSKMSLMELPNPVHSEITNPFENQRWTADSLAQYPMLQWACDVAAFSSYNLLELATAFQGLITAFRRLLSSANLSDLAEASVDYKVVCEENELLRARIITAKAFPVSDEPVQCLRTPARSKSDLNRTDVFEVVERICEQAEDEKETLEKELRNSRYDLERLRGNSNIQF